MRRSESDVAVEIIADVRVVVQFDGLVCADGFVFAARRVSEQEMVHFGSSEQRRLGVEDFHRGLV